MMNWNLYALEEIKLPSVWSRARHYRIALVWANIYPSNTCSGSFTCTSNCVSEEKETRKCNLSHTNLFKTIFCLNFRGLKWSKNQNPGNMTNIKGSIFWGSRAQVWINAGGEGRLCPSENCWLGHIAPPCWKS